MSRCIREIKESFGRKVSLRAPIQSALRHRGTGSPASTCSHHTKTKTDKKTKTEKKTTTKTKQRQTGIEIHIVVVREVCGRQKILWDFVVKAIFGKPPIRWERKGNKKAHKDVKC